MKINLIRKGFTLIEVLLVIAILAILAAIVIVAINPAKQMASARDSSRLNDVNAILSAIHQYAIDNEGSFPDNLSTTELEICREGNTDCTGFYDLSVLTEDQEYLVSIPTDPSCLTGGDPFCSEGAAGYYVYLTDGNRVHVWSRGAELAEEISVTR